MLPLGIRKPTVTTVLPNFPVCYVSECNVIFTRAVSSYKAAGDGTAHHPWRGRRGIPNLSIAPLKGKGIKILLGSTFITKTYNYPKPT